MNKYVDFKAFRKDTEAALEEVAKKYGINIHAGKISYDDNTFTMQLKAERTDVDVAKAKFESDLVFMKHYPQISEIMAELRGAESDSQESKQVIDLSKPNSHLHEPLFPGLSWTARDFDVLGTYLGEELISYIEDKNGPLEDDCMKRLLEMKDECSEIYAASAYAKELSERLKLRKEQRENRKGAVK